VIGADRQATGAAVGERAETVADLRTLLDELPDELVALVFTHSSWTDRRSATYERLAFLGDSVLALSVSAHLYPRLDPERFGAGRLTKIRAQAVSGRSCRGVAERLGIPQRLLDAAPPQAAASTASLVGAERLLAEVTEAVIGACFLAHGYERTAKAVVQAFTPEIDAAMEGSVDYKSALQELLARRGAVVVYDVVGEEGPPHDRVFSVSAVIEGEEVGRGRGRSKKDAEQQAAQAALVELER
jgi:ribonuclease III